MSTTISLVGAGNMGSALLTKWIAADLPYSYNVVAPNPTKEINELENSGQITINSKSTVADILVIAVKPQVFSSITAELSSMLSTDTLVISIMAGIKIKRIAEELGAVKLVRAMPNTPCSIGKGTVLLTKSKETSHKDLKTAQALMNVLGHVEPLEDEDTLDIATAISGCGPAYVYMLTECMAKAGITHGLEPELAARLARSTVEGAGALMQYSTNSPEALRQAVTSRGGITEAALQVLLAPEACPSLFEQAYEAVFARSKTISKT